MGETFRNSILKDLLQELEVPQQAYITAEQRYKQLGEWLRTPGNAESAEYGPNIVSHGSFNLGTVVMPLEKGDYDLDLCCILSEKISTGTHTQKDIKDLVGNDLRKYRIKKGIKDQVEENAKCWTLNYQDGISFHMDIVPAIPGTSSSKNALMESVDHGISNMDLSKNISDLAIYITDTENPSYRRISDQWKLSNPEGYSRWFVSRMEQQRILLESAASREMVGSINELPIYKWKQPLQHCVQILKRHRDIMFKYDPDDLKPKSIQFTTLAAHAYSGEENIEEAMFRIIENMDKWISGEPPYLINPANPAEDFAEKWTLNPELKDTFMNWLEDVKKVFSDLQKDKDIEIIHESASTKFGVELKQDILEKKADLFYASNIISGGVASTGPTGKISETGVKNPQHQFYGD